MWNLFARLFARAATAPSEHAPLTAFERARIEWFERYGCAGVERNRMFLGWVLTTSALLAACLATLLAQPLRHGGELCARFG